MSKRAVNLWIDEALYAWLKEESARRGMSMTQLLKDLMIKERGRLHAERRPEQY
jgi:hypothetical protein